MDCASAAALCKGPSLDVQNATTVLNDVRDLVADSSPQAIRDLDELIRLNLGVQEMLVVCTVSLPPTHFSIRSRPTESFQTRRS